ncbi:unnamed protein product [Enterobius vermicularis]|uniref:Uncharacterized protein n=1 Tax=Enterobius vermicularis TaxID=51028 RepID=A0A0N4VI25_ENTVE|nr:unnamed protein product [Enterobius vermicularis]
MENDNLHEYRTLCAIRLRRLERCKKAKSFCSLEDEYNGFGMPTVSATKCRSQTNEMVMREHRNAAAVSRNYSFTQQSTPTTWQNSAATELRPIQVNNDENVGPVSNNKFEVLRQSLVSQYFNILSYLSENYFCLSFS